jgi:uncharacterized protein YehS (DUF1456 family)
MMILVHAVHFRLKNTDVANICTRDNYEVANEDLSRLMWDQKSKPRKGRVMRTKTMKAISHVFVPRQPH